MSDAEEFGTMATWTADSVERLGEEHALPAACQGSGTPAALRWLWEHLGLAPERTLLDAGAGLGGPAALAVRETEARAVLVDPMQQACAAAERLFGLPTAVGDAGRLPMPDGCYDAAWSLGVLCTLVGSSDDQPQALRELVRVVRPGGPVGLLVFVRTVQRLPVATPDNDFPTWSRLRTVLDAASLRVVDDSRLDDFPDVDAEWSQRADRVSEDVRDHRGADPRWRRADAQQRLVAGLIEDGLVEGVVVACRAE